jgi:ferredoxin-NADP reductase
MLPPWQTGIVKQIEQVTSITRRYWLELPETTNFDFKAGQFITLDLPIHEQRNKRWRSYSIASMPDGTNVIELLIVYLQGGLASEYIFNEIKEGSPFTLRGPQGVFVIPGDLGKDLYMICTGTGIAPFRSMLQYIQHHSIPHGDIHLVFGTRTREGLLYANEMKELEQTMPGFKYHQTLSRERWEGKRGYVHPIYEELCSEKKPSIFMLCGWREMIDEAKERIVKMGYDRKDIHVEIYG